MNGKKIDPDAWNIRTVDATAQQTGEFGEDFGFGTNGKRVKGYGSAFATVSGTKPRSASADS